MYPLITIDLLVRVTHRIKPHREKDMVSLAAQEWIRQGRAEGIAEAILVALETRFGPVPEDIEALVRQAAPEKLSGMLRRAFTTPSPQALFTDESWH
jgi:RecJ-like exonuclease